MPTRMENCAAVSGRRRGTTKHSVEDQALDQIAREKLVNVGGEKQKSNEEEEEEEEEEKEKKKAEEEEQIPKDNDIDGGDCDESSLDDFYDDISAGKSDDEDTKYRKILSEAENKLSTCDKSAEENDKDLIFENKRDEMEVFVEDGCEGEEKKEGREEEVFSEVVDGVVEGSREGSWGQEDDADCDLAELLGRGSIEAEARLAARRQARVEAREIRLRELERQQKENEENADKVFDMTLASENIIRTGRPVPLLNSKERPGATNSYHSSRRSSEDSLEDGSYCLRDIKHELKELDEKFRKAMIANAQLDNEKSELTYQVELLKDRLEDLEEAHAQVSRECRDKTREHEQLKRVAIKLKEELTCYKKELEERDRLIAEYGLVIVGGEGGEDGPSERVLVSKETEELLEQAGDGSLDVRLKKLASERNELLDEVRHLKLELEEERSKKRSDSRSGYSSLTNGPLDEETSKLLSDYRFKLQKAEQDVSTLQANVARLESQVIRYKSAAESSEKAEDELKIEKRKLQRENRESIARIEELETANSHLMRRMDKLKNAKSTLLKEL